MNIPTLQLLPEKPMQPGDRFRVCARWYIHPGLEVIYKRQEET